MIPHAADPQPATDDSPRAQLARAIGGTLVGDDLIAIGERSVHADTLGRVWLYQHRGDSGTSLGLVADGATVLAARYAAVLR